MEDHSCNHDRHRRKRLREFEEEEEEDEEDRLSILPDAILTDILSLLSLNTAVSTSILSHRWRHLWTGVSSFHLHYPNRIFNPPTFRILSQLTSPIIRKFALTCNPSTWKEFPRDLSYDLARFPLVSSRKVEEIEVISHKLFVPRCVFQCETLVSLDLFVKMECKFSIVTTIGLVNLKNLRLYCGKLASFRPISALFKSCPRLEDLCLIVDLLKDENLIEISAPKLKWLNVKMSSAKYQNVFVINAPELVDVKIKDGRSFYRFAGSSARLVSACVELSHEARDREDGGMEQGLCLGEIGKFVQGLSSVSKLQLNLNMNLFTYLDSVVDGDILVFRNLLCFKLTLNRDISPGDFVLSLQCAPNLEDLEVIIEHNPLSRFWNWCPPKCLLSKLKTVKVLGLRGYDVELTLLRFISKNAIALEVLQIEVCIKFGIDRDDQIRMERRFYEAFLKLPRSSSTLKLVVSGKYIKATSDAIERQVT